ncbi:MAG: hypothetical protein WC976_07055 [Caldisericia bacterium]
MSMLMKWKLERATPVPYGPTACQHKNTYGLDLMFCYRIDDNNAIYDRERQITDDAIFYIEEKIVGKKYCEYKHPWAYYNYAVYLHNLTRDKKHQITKVLKKLVAKRRKLELINFFRLINRFKLPYALRSWIELKIAWIRSWYDTMYLPFNYFVGRYVHGVVACLVRCFSKKGFDKLMYSPWQDPLLWSPFFINFRRSPKKNIQSNSKK